MTSARSKAIQAAAFLNHHMVTSPRIGLLTGTGLGDIVDAIDADVSLPYAEIPHFCRSTVQSHSGMLIAGMLSGKPIVALQGRFHLYEGYHPLEVTFPIRVMQELGVRTLILSNAAGGLNTAFNAGDVMLIRDHINLTGENPLVGPNEDRWGPRFPDMGFAYSRRLTALAEDAGAKIEVKPCHGVYAGLKGPCLETPAEVRYLKAIGADAVGFSTVMEAIAGRHAGMELLGISIITNVHDPAQPQPAAVDEIIRVAGTAAPIVAEIIKGVVAGII